MATTTPLAWRLRRMLGSSFRPVCCLASSLGECMVSSLSCCKKSSQLFVSQYLLPWSASPGHLCPLERWAYSLCIWTRSSCSQAPHQRLFLHVCNYGCPLHQATLCHWLLLIGLRLSPS
eukprot:Mycagemm_TRINITY_DN9819_c0_g3::TRINITY_DN9819_c0_g3_i1::g.259::m.259 type:complete len:119 gc:universal TRINITY_DN9819_c0_g3_i1:302-658(+)